MTVLASQPSVSIDTEITQRTCSPSLPGLPTVLSTSRSRSSSVSSSTARPGKRRCTSALSSSISREAMRLKSALIASPDSSCSLSMRIVAGRAVQRPSGVTLENSSSLPGTATLVPSSSSLSQPDTWSKTSLETLVLLHTTMNTGGVRPCTWASVSACHWAKRCW